MPAIHLVIKGKVQGVFYRATAKEVADEIGLTGWVRNTDDGDVEAIASGTQDQLQRFVEWCKTGPKKAVVADVIVTDIPDEKFTSFSIKR